jgi:hypothetical protein
MRAATRRLILVIDQPSQRVTGEIGPRDPSDRSNPISTARLPLADIASRGSQGVVVTWESAGKRELMRRR